MVPLNDTTVADKSSVTRSKKKTERTKCSESSKRIHHHSSDVEDRTSVTSSCAVLVGDRVNDPLESTVDAIFIKKKTRRRRSPRGHQHQSSSSPCPKSRGGSPNQGHNGEILWLPPSSSAQMKSETIGHHTGRREQVRSETRHLRQSKDLTLSKSLTPTGGRSSFSCTSTPKLDRRQRRSSSFDFTRQKSADVPRDTVSHQTKTRVHGKNSLGNVLFLTVFCQMSFQKC